MWVQSISLNITIIYLILILKESFSIPVAHVSDTAFLVCGYRVLESKRVDSLFDDRIAEVFLVDAPSEVKEILFNWDFAQWVVAVRTAIIDRCLKRLINQGATSVLNLAAGLDTRPYRLSLPYNLRWIEVDFADLMHYKQEKLKSMRPNCNLKRVALDLSDVAETGKFLSHLTSAISRGNKTKNCRNSLSAH